MVRPDKDYPFQTIIMAARRRNILKTAPNNPTLPSILALAAGIGMLLFAAEFLITMIKGCTVVH